MSPSEIAFLALGLVLGAALGAALVEAARARPAPRREVRITVSPNSITPRRSLTLATPDREAGLGLIPGSPADDGWLERRLAGESQPVRVRTRVPSAPVGVPATAIAVPVAVSATVGASPQPRGTGRNAPVPDPATASLVRAATAGSTAVVLDRVAQEEPLPSRQARPEPSSRESVRVPAALPATLDLAAGSASTTTRVRPPAPPARVTLPRVVEAVRMGDRGDRVTMLAARRTGDAHRSEPPAVGGSAGPQGAAPASSCEAERTLVQERCGLADAAREQARLAADSLREAQRAYDVLRERVDRAQQVADPRELRAAKDAIHRAFRAARAAAGTAEASEAAARDWLNEVNRLNTAAREAARVIESGNAELRVQLPRLERLAVEADAARIAAESAEVACRDARESLARCEEQALQAATAEAARQAVPEEPTARELAWPSEPETPLARPTEPDEAAISEPSAVIRILRGDRAARDRVITTLAGRDADSVREWQLRLAELVDAIAARAIEDGYLDLPDDGFWGLFAHRERREIVTALSALGFRFDGLGGFADGRVPAQRDLSLAVGYAGLDRMRIRNWPRESELAGLYARAVVAADEWLADAAGDLSLGRMVDALGARAAELADVWNSWGRVRPLLLSAD